MIIIRYDKSFLIERFARLTGVRKMQASDNA
jgi:hypothetical protein